MFTAIVVRDDVFTFHSLPSIKQARIKLMSAVLFDVSNNSTHSGVHSNYPSDNSGVDAYEMMSTAHRLLRLSGIEVLWSDGLASGPVEELKATSKESVDMEVWKSIASQWNNLHHRLSPLSGPAPAVGVSQGLRGVSVGNMIVGNTGSDGVCDVDVDGCTCDALHPDGRGAKATLDHVLNERKHYYHAAIVLHHAMDYKVDSSSESPALTGVNISTCDFCTLLVALV